MWNDTSFLLLDRIRTTINVLKKSDYCRNPNTEEGGILTHLKELQSKLRSSDSGSIEIPSVVLPFSEILKNSNFAGPFKLSALESLQSFIKSGIFQNSRNDMTQAAIREIVVSVTTCKFVQTDHHIDEIVQLQLLKTLQFMIQYIPHFMVLSCSWDVSQFFLKTLTLTGGQRPAGTRHLLAQESIQQSLQLLIQSLHVSTSSASSEKLPSASTNISGPPGTASLSSMAVNDEELFNLKECFHHFLAFIASYMRKFTVASSVKAANNADGNGTNSGNRSPAPGVNPAGNSPRPSTSSSSLSQLNFTMAETDQYVLIFFLQQLQFIWCSSQNLTHLCSLLLCDEKISNIFHNDIFFCLINIGSQWEALPIKTLQNILSFYTTLIAVGGGLIRHVVDNFMRQVYLKALMKYIELLNLQIGVSHPLKDLLNQNPSMNEDGSSSVISGNNSSGKHNPPAPNPKDPMLPTQIVRIEVLEIIFESLTDLLCEDAYLPCLYASFDCNPLAVDLVQPLIQLISRATSIILTTGTEKLGNQKDLGVCLVQCYKQLLHSFSRRKSSSEHWFDEKNNLLFQNKMKNKSSKLPSHYYPQHFNTSASSGKNDNNNIPVSAAAALATPNNIKHISNLFSIARLSKKILMESAEKFLIKPTLCFQYLQEQGLLPKPLTTKLCANFLRQNIFLDKIAVGAFLGELGKSSEKDLQNIKHECETATFHANLLKNYVESFELQNLTILNSMRLFLSAFRLPGEAQQIDRILVAFSEYCYEMSWEKSQNIIENHEISYLLMFSIIMLNTDRHNPNIRIEKKMTLEQFIRNNLNYGKDVKQTQPLPRDYLEMIYHSIGEHQIRTQGNDSLSLVTDEEWMDLNMMMKTNPFLSLLISTRQSDEVITNLLAHDSLLATNSAQQAAAPAPSATTNAVLSPSLRIIPAGTPESTHEPSSSGAAQTNLFTPFLSPSKKHKKTHLQEKDKDNNHKDIEGNEANDEDEEENDQQSIYSVLKGLFSSNHGWYSTLNLSTLFSIISNLDWIWDHDLLSCTSSFILLPGLSVLIYNNYIVEETIYIEETPDMPIADNHKLYEWKERTGRLMELSTDFLMEILSIASRHNLWKMIDMVIAILLQICGLKETDIAQTFIKMVSLPNEYPWTAAANSSCMIESDPLPALPQPYHLHHPEGQQSQQSGDFDYSQYPPQPTYPDHCFFIQRISYGSVQRSLLLLLNIFSQYYASISNWYLLLYPLTILRDFTVLPTDLVFSSFGGGNITNNNNNSNTPNDNNTDLTNNNTATAASSSNLQNELLPSNVKQEFEFSLHQLDRQDYQNEQEFYERQLTLFNLKNKELENQNTSTRSSFFAFQLLGEALFGSSTSPSNSNTNGGNGNDKKSINYKKKFFQGDELTEQSHSHDEHDDFNSELIDLITEKYNVRSSRWDAGYEGANNNPNYPIPLLEEDENNAVADNNHDAQSSRSSRNNKKSKAAAAASPTSYLGQRLAHHTNQKPPTPRPNIHPENNPFAKTVKWDVDSMRAMVTRTNISTIIAESKFLPDDHLLSLLRSIIRITEVDPSTSSGNPSDPSSSDPQQQQQLLEMNYEISKDSATSSTGILSSLNANNNNSNNNSGNNHPTKTVPIHYYRNSENFLDTSSFISLGRIHRYVSKSSIAWLEMMLIEIALRNRDRFALYWPILKLHYQKCLGNQFTRLSYVSERQLNGLLKLTARMLSRDNYAGILIELLSRIFTPLIRLQQQQLLQQQQASLKSASIELTTAAMESAAASVAAPSLVPTAVASAATKSRKQRDNHHHKNDNDDDDDVLSFDSPNPHTTNDSLQGLSNQIAAGMWRILTQNVDLLPLLSLEQWECLFKIIAFGSNSGSFAAFKSFEVMAWLLHEPRLFASVPVFCIIAVKPLVYNKQAPIFVSTGAVKLLKYLHSRLEAIIHDSYKPKGSADSNDNDNNNNNNNDNKNNAGNTAGNSNNNGGNEKDLKKNNDLGRRSRGNSEDFDEFTTIDETSFAVWKKCWLPILHALAEGVADERIPVREACASALCDAINDRHSYAVPPGILIDVLVHILSPVIRVLGDYLITDLNKQALSSSSLLAETVTLLPPPSSSVNKNTRHIQHQPHQTAPVPAAPAVGENEWITVEPPQQEASAHPHAHGPLNHSVKNELAITSELMNSSNYPQNLSQLSSSSIHHPANALNLESNVIVKCIDTLTTVFMKHVKKLSHYPSFDKLWLQLLQILTYFIELTPSMTGQNEVLLAAGPPSPLPSQAVSAPPPPAVPGVLTNPPPPTGGSSSNNNNNSNPNNPTATTAVMTLPPAPPAGPTAQQQILFQLAKICCGKLELVIRCLQREKVFVKKESLWIVTKEFLSQLHSTANNSLTQPLFLAFLTDEYHQLQQQQQSKK